LQLFPRQASARDLAADAQGNSEGTAKKAWPRQWDWSRVCRGWADQERRFPHFTAALTARLVLLAVATCSGGRSRRAMISGRST
jgi:hypothetical protein